MVWVGVGVGVGGGGGGGVLNTIQILVSGGSMSDSLTFGQLHLTVMIKLNFPFDIAVFLLADMLFQLLTISVLSARIF